MDTRKLIFISSSLANEIAANCSWCLYAATVAVNLDSNLDWKFAWLLVINVTSQSGQATDQQTSSPGEKTNNANLYTGAQACNQKAASPNSGCHLKSLLPGRHSLPVCLFSFFTICLPTGLGFCLKFLLKSWPRCAGRPDTLEQGTKKGPDKGPFLALVCQNANSH